MMKKIKWHRSDSIGSTNTYLRELNGGDPAYDYEVAVADFQTAGRGQKGNTWESEQGKNLLFSILAHPKGIKVQEQFYISEAIALAVSDAVIAAAGPEYAAGFSVKWSNDIYYKDCKMAGILIENTLEEGYLRESIVGIGLNLNESGWPEELPNPVSLHELTGRHYSPQDELRRLHKEIRRRFARLGSADGRKSLQEEFGKYMFRLPEEPK